jgi:hypothetical protein
VNSINAVAEGKVTIVPEVLVSGGGGSFDGLAATLIRNLTNGGGNGAAQEPAGVAAGMTNPAAPATTEQAVPSAPAASKTEKRARKEGPTN